MSGELTYKAYTPPQYQIKHQFEDAVVTITAHAPALEACSCGFRFENDKQWADHLAGLLFRRPEW